MMHSCEYSDISEEFVTVVAEDVDEGIMKSFYRRIQYYRKFISNYIYSVHEGSCHEGQRNVQPELVNVFNFLYANGQ